MPSTRSSARQAAAAAGSSPAPSQGKQTPTASTGDKRKASSVTPSKSKRGKKNETKEQTTIEATMPTEQKDTDSKEVEMKDAGEEKSEKVAEESSKPATGEGVEPTHQTNGEAKEDAKVTANGEVQEQSESATKVEEIGKVEPNASAKSGGGVSSGDAVEESSQREKSTPASILEKGIIYFFFRGRVGIDEPSDVNEIARSYIILRPIPHGAKLGDGPIGDANTNRMLALPKKVLPAGPKDRFMVFVEKAKESMDDIKGSLSSSDYATKTAGTRHSPAAAPVAEGIYAITTTGRESHLAYILTIPSELGEVQKEVGLQQRGSFVTSVKNPQYSGPANASLPQGPEYPKEILDEFRSLRWMPLQPKLLDFVNTQFLVIGHKDNALEKATVQQTDDEKADKAAPVEEMEKLEHEDEIRVEHLSGDDSIFDDLTLSSQEYRKLQTTW